ncbi:MAG: CPBP family intramembrane glutamic endopeptidase [Planctomycetota bacterium]|nr:CPBP family intramembrane glutamic endopeptidase [Planctomycetota bacterium]
MSDTGESRFEMPNGTVAVVDAVFAFVLLFVPGVCVALLHRGYGAPLGRVEVGVLGLLAGFGALGVYAWVRRRALTWDLRLAWALTRYGLFMLIWFPAAFWIYPMVMRELGIPLPAQDVLLYVASGPHGGFLWMAVFVACILAPLGEELFFRGFLFRAIEVNSHRYMALAMTSLLFALTHERSVMLPVLGLGLLFGYVRMKTGGVGSSILLHMVHNSWTVMVAMVAPETLDLVFDK